MCRLCELLQRPMGGTVWRCTHDQQELPGTAGDLECLPVQRHFPDLGVTVSLGSARQISHQPCSPPLLKVGIAGGQVGHQLIARRVLFAINGQHAQKGDTATSSCWPIGVHGADPLIAKGQMHPVALGRFDLSKVDKKLDGHSIPSQYIHASVEHDRGRIGQTIEQPMGQRMDPTVATRMCFGFSGQAAQIALLVTVET